MTQQADNQTLNGNGAAAASPIADLTYRNYDGPLKTRYARWWIVAKAGIRPLPRKWWFWVLGLMSSLSYVRLMVLLYVQSRMPAGARFPMLEAEPGHVFATHFYQAFEWQLFWLMALALIVGAGIIASDNRTNALMVYLSKPLTKGDYLLGKWAGLFLSLYIVALAPALLSYAYCLLAYMSDGFLKHEPWLIVRILAACAVPAAVYASLLSGISAWSKSPLVAGAIAAGLYFGTSIISGSLSLMMAIGDAHRANSAGGLLLQHASVGGLVQGVVWNIFGVKVTRLMVDFRHGGMPETITVHPPLLWAVAGAAAAVVVLGLVAARARVRAVEVVKG